MSQIDDTRPVKQNKYTFSLYSLFTFLFLLCAVEGHCMPLTAAPLPAAAALVHAVTLTSSADSAKEKEKDKTSQVTLQGAAEAETEQAWLYAEYQKRLEAPVYMEDIEKNGFLIIEGQIFTMIHGTQGELVFVPAIDQQYGRMVVFFVNEHGKLVFRTDQLETNNRNADRLRQPNRGIAAVAFQDLNGDEMTDIILLTFCVNDSGAFAGKSYRVGDVLFQNDRGFYRDWRISDKINRFSMNKSAEFIAAFVRDGYSTEFLYTASTLNELLGHGFEIIEEQCYWRTFEKLGRLRVVPGTYRMAEYDLFMIYLINEQGYIVWSFQPMAEYDNLYALKGISCRDIDGDGMKDVVVLARYSREGTGGDPLIESDFSIYYQRTGGFNADMDFKKQYRVSDTDTMAGLVEEARAYWGWESE